MTQHILSLSYGKDSLACLGAIELLGWPLDRIIHAEIWATDTIPADLPPMVEFKKRADEIIRQRWGIEVEHICARDKDGSKLTYEKIFYRVPNRKSDDGFEDGTFAGFPYTKGAWCNDRLKTNPLDSASEMAPPPPADIWVPDEERSLVQFDAQDQNSRQGLIYGFPISVRQGNWCTALKQRVFFWLPCTRSEYKYCAVPRHSCR